ncbi:uncharacterized protein LOC144344640 [Saccoglossus kowalevskii]
MPGLQQADFGGQRNVVSDAKSPKLPAFVDVYIRERAPTDLDELAVIAKQYLVAHGRQLSTKDQVRRNDNKTAIINTDVGQGSSIRCFVCQGIGHRASQCPSHVTDVNHDKGKQCLQCGAMGHVDKFCCSGQHKGQERKSVKPSTTTGAAAVIKESNISASCAVQINSDVPKMIEKDHLLLASGEQLNVVNGACMEPSGAVEDRTLPVGQGKVGDTTVTMLRDTVCNGIIVKKSLVPDDQYTKKMGHILMVDRTVRRVPVAMVEIDTPYLRDTVEALCVQDPIYELIVGNVPGARPPDEPDPVWNVSGAGTTRAQAQKSGKVKPLKVCDVKTGAHVTKDKLIDMQQADTSLKKYYNKREPEVKGHHTTEFQVYGGLIYRVYRDRSVPGGKTVCQVVVLKLLRTRVMEIAHDSIFGGHMRIKKTEDRIEMSPQPDVSETSYSPNTAIDLMTAVRAATAGCNESDEENAVDEDDLLELGTCKPNESGKDVQIGTQLTEHHRKELVGLVNTYYKVFIDLPEKTKIISHKIDLTNDTPIRSKPYSLPYAIRENLRQDIEDMLKTVVISKSSSPYTSPVVIVEKKNGSNRICVDYRKLNKVTVTDPEPIVTTGDIFQRLHDSKFLSKIYLSEGYWQIPVAEEDIPKTAFFTPDGTDELLRMPFGMKDSGTTLVRGIRKLLSGMEGLEAI